MFHFIRKHRGLFSIIFVLAALGMVISLFNTGSGTPGASSIWNSGSAAKVMGEKISVNEFAQAYDYKLREAQAAMNEQFKGQATDPQTRAFLEKLIQSQVNPQSVLNNLIQQRFILAVAKEHGFRVPPTAIRYLLEKTPAFQKDGRFDPLTYKQYVARPGDYEKQLKMQLLRDSIFYNFSMPLAVVSQAELKENEVLKQNFIFEILEVKADTIKYDPTVSESELAQFHSDTSRVAELKSYYEKLKSEFEKAAQVHAKHILIRENEGGEKKAIEIRKEISEGKLSFEEAAKKYSSDKSNADKGGDLGFFEHKTMDPKFSDAAFALTPEQALSGVVKSSFGFHLIKFVDRKPELKRSFEEVKTELVPRYLKEKLRRDYVLAQLKGAAEEAKVLSKAQLSELATEWKKQGAWTPLDDSIGTLNVSSLNLAELLKLEKPGSVYSKVVPQGDSFYLIKLVEKNNSVEQDSLRALIAERSALALQSYLDIRMKDLEDKKKIFRNEDILAQFQAPAKN